MDDFITAVREGNTQRIHDFLEKWDGSINDSEEHGFTALHWAAKDGRETVVDLLIARGANVHSTNMGEDTPLHLAASCGHLLIRNRASVNAVNEHGNTPLHYATFWAYRNVVRELLNQGAVAAQANKYGKTPIDFAYGELKQELKSHAKSLKQPLSPKPYVASTLTNKIHKPWVAGSEILLSEVLFDSPLGELWTGSWSQVEIVARRYIVGDISNKMIREIPEEIAKLKSSFHPNVQPILGICQQAPSIFVLSEYMPHGSLFNVLHQSTDIEVDTAQALKFATDIARGMAYVHGIKPNLPRLNLSPRHILISSDLTAKISLSDIKFSFLVNEKIYYPHWISPEALQGELDDDATKLADMWSFAIILWELATQKVPYAGLSPMEIGLKIALEHMQPRIPSSMSTHISKLIKICWNVDPVKRPRFDMIIPILEKM
ncbi:uncharacterized protein TRIADDRAFT_30386 [Trichoplax adhaerens]|uniref:Protein kinase domain-containing protein n=1 Tax=Trichoplax adhaerens TaxID=10228 RepID=B3S792_TRIAD|nr:hypothetical protein TRIADDRAFT_30386 [Trichoplax adhaerens]EDV21444.1 hypothetical protein TRIADDRAFT_30386 [Trichoplax adhaerens]|eukprot:XP_002116044.1 hypothetical protein TRIADDRAFT_30386 [Trichoplax adhaerens]